jgi:hypothetical protein
MKKKGLLGMLAGLLAFGMVLSGCPTETDTWTLKELLRKYMAPSSEIWGEDEEYTYVYYLDHLRIEEFKAELFERGEYTQGNDDPLTYTRDWNEGKTFAKWAERPDDTFELELCGSNNSTDKYTYETGQSISAAQRQKLDELLRKYMGAMPGTWENDIEEHGDQYSYSLDFDHFEDFRSELNAKWIGYSVFYFWDSTDTDDDTSWIGNKNFAWWAERDNGEFELVRCKDDNTGIEYYYAKGHP